MKNRAGIFLSCKSIDANYDTQFNPCTTYYTPKTYSVAKTPIKKLTIVSIVQQCKLYALQYTVMCACQILVAVLCLAMFCYTQVTLAQVKVMSPQERKTSSLAWCR